MRQTITTSKCRGLGMTKNGHSQMPVYDDGMIELTDSPYAGALLQINRHHKLQTRLDLIRCLPSGF